MRCKFYFFLTAFSNTPFSCVARLTANERKQLPTIKGNSHRQHIVNRSIILQIGVEDTTRPVLVKTDKQSKKNQRIKPTLHAVEYEGWSKIFRTDTVKIIKLTIRPIGRRHPRSSSLLHVDTGPTIFSIFGTLPGSPFRSECQALSAIRPGSPQWYRTGVLSALISVLEIGRSHRVPNQGSTVGGE